MQNFSKKDHDFTAQYRIYYEDTDAGGVVYYANYLKFFERARTDFLRLLNFSQSDLIKKENLAFVVRKCEVEYISPAKLDDLITISATPQDIGASYFEMKQEMKRGEELLSTLIVKIVCVSIDKFKPKRIPEYIINQIKNG
jgi:acyl-CoA thioester hydrolase